MAKGLVYLVGAGPGDPKLITVKGLECIKKADVIVYDRLSSPRLLAFARPDAELIYAGKSPEKHVLRQDEINEVIVAKAKEGKVVTRLKGGDPFVFGRGGEEAESLLEAGIGYEVVPGITSAIAVPAYAGIPVTHREFTSSLAVITGNEDPRKDDTSIAWEKLSIELGTLVFLMGMANLPHIVEQLLTNGCPAETPVALIHWGTRPEQQTVTGTLTDIVAKAREAGLKHPVIIVIGEVVKLRDKLQWFEKKPLFGQRVVVTRSRSQASVLSEKIEEMGGEPWEFPTIDIAPPEDYGPMDRAINEIESYDWIVFTSVNGVTYFMDRLKALDRDIRDLKGVKLCAIGPKTREEIENYGLKCEFIPGEFRAEGILEVLQGEDIKGRKFLLPRADIARKVLPEMLREMGAIVTEADAYKTVMGGANVELLRDMLAKKRVQYVTFTSSSTVKNFVKMLGRENLGLLAGVKIASIGPITSDTAVKLGLKVDIEARQYTIDGLVEAILEHR